MIVSWMLYAAAVGLILFLGAAGTARMLRAVGRPERWVWAVALAGTVIIPVVQPFLQGMDGGSTVTDPATSVIALPALPTPEALEDVVPGVPLSALAVGLWLSLSLMHIAVLVRAASRVGQLSPGPTSSSLPIQWTRNLGPAVTGLLRPRILLPRWLRELPRRERRWILRHEAEHLRARDLILHNAGRMACALLPWNPGTFLLRRGLARALETDCDRRVLGSASLRSAWESATPGRASNTSVRSYGETLLRVASRRTGTAMALGTFNPRITSLEHRIRTMTTPRRHWTPLLAALAILLAAGTFLVACDMPSPTVESELDARIGEQEYVPEADFEARETPNADSLTFTPYTVPPEILNREDVMKALGDEYPPALREAGVEGTVNVWYFIDEEGRVEATRIQQSSGHEALDQAALRVAAMMEFSPALNRDEPVGVWVAFPITFRTRTANEGS